MGRLDAAGNDDASVLKRRRLTTQAQTLRETIEALEKQKTINDQKLSRKQSKPKLTSQLSKAQSASLDRATTHLVTAEGSNASRTSDSINNSDSLTTRFVTWLQKCTTLQKCYSVQLELNQCDSSSTSSNAEVLTDITITADELEVRPM